MKDKKDVEANNDTKEDNFLSEDSNNMKIDKEKLNEQIKERRKMRTQFKTVKEPIELQKKLMKMNLNLNFNIPVIKEEIKEDEKEEEKEEKKEIKKEKEKENEKENTKIEMEKKESIPVKKFKRKGKRSTTLIEKFQLSHQLFIAEMQLPVKQENLVIQIYGNPKKKYKCTKKLGSGSFGSVYEAVNETFNNKVAMKVIRKDPDNRLDEQEIKNEIDIMTKLSHPNIVRIYEFYISNSHYYIITEFCEEGELFNYIKVRFNERQLAVLFYQIFSGLCYLHENKIIHRDIKLENIMVSKKEKDYQTGEELFWIKIIDFGTAKIFEKNKKEREIVGSSYYIAPEVLNKNYNEKCDTWSVGVILYMTLVGKAPFDGRDDDEIILKINKVNYNNKEPKLICHSPEVQDLVKGLLEKNVEKRLSAREALNHPWFEKFGGRSLYSNFKKEEIEPFINNLLNYTFNSKIQQLVIAFLVHNLPNDESSINILKLFRYFNKSGNCKLTKEELKNGLYEYRNKEEVDKVVEHLFLLLDGDINGFIEYEEFLRACIDKKIILTEKYLKYAFKFLDKEKTETLNAEKIIKAFFIQSNKIVETSFNNAINSVDHDNDGIINFEEFKELMLKCMN